MTSGRRDNGGKKGGKKGSKGSKLDWYGDRDKGSTGNKGKGKGKSKGKNETRHCCDCGEQGHIGVNCPHKWPKAQMKKMVKHHRGRVSLKERMLKNTRAWRHLTIGMNCPYKWANSIDEEDDQTLSWAESPGGEGDLTHDQHSTVWPKMTKTSRRQGD